MVLPGSAQPDRAGVDEARAEQGRLLGGPLGQVATADPAGKAEVVADQRAGARLPAERLGSNSTVRSPSEAP
jgi:hypothetical protein